MKTSYFWKHLNNMNAVSIARKSPKEFMGREYKKLAPTYDMIMKYKKTGNWENYEREYKRKILSKLDPRKVYNELGPDAVLCCYELPMVNCHRHIVAIWLMGAIIDLVVREE